ncbi:MAG: hypothetical protein K6T30_10415, partial [Alicyclobacillus sp.]|nr:hypothetical protein [Alicyclobacillus sp.]
VEPLPAIVIGLVAGAVCYLAVAVVKGWRNALAGIAAGIAALAALVALLGPLLLRYVPLDVIKVVLGLFLLLFGLRWLRKAILRYAGYKALHDEGEAFAKELERQQSAGGAWTTGGPASALGEGDPVPDDRPGVASGAALRAAPASVPVWDAFGIATVFNGVFLEGLEAVFIVLTMGMTARALSSAVAGGVCALAVVGLAGVVLRKPLQFVPENTMKFVVGVLLSSFGTLWVAEGAGADWWHGDASVLVLIALYLAASGLAVRWLKRGRQSA